jgi:hypothetical protein
MHYCAEVERDPVHNFRREFVDLVAISLNVPGARRPASELDLRRYRRIRPGARSEAGCDF